MVTVPPPDLVSRFRLDLEAVAGPGRAPFGVAVSGGPDSLALLLLAHAAFPERVRAATVDHGLRAGSAAEAESVARLCGSLSVQHFTLAATVERAGEGLQAAARARPLLGSGRMDGPARPRPPPHRPSLRRPGGDSADAPQPRLGRGGACRGQGRGRRPGTGGRLRLCRPLLGWRRSELQAIVEAAGVEAARDPSNEDEAYDRARLRRRLGEAPWLDPAGLARSAALLAEAEAAFGMGPPSPLFAARTEEEGGAVTLRPGGLPPELLRRLVLRCLRRLAPEAKPRGEALAAFIGPAAGRRRGHFVRGQGRGRRDVALRAGAAAANLTAVDRVAPRPGLRLYVPPIPPPRPSVLAGCGEPAEDDRPRANSIEELENRLDALADRTTEEIEPPPRLANLKEADLGPELRANPACRLHRNGRLLLVVNAAGAVARIDGKRVPLAVTGPVGPTGGFLTGPGVTVSVGRTEPSGNDAAEYGMGMAGAGDDRGERGAPDREGRSDLDLRSLGPLAQQQDAAIARPEGGGQQIGEGEKGAEQNGGGAGDEAAGAPAVAPGDPAGDEEQMRFEVRVQLGPPRLAKVRRERLEKPGKPQRGQRPQGHRGHPEPSRHQIATKRRHVRTPPGIRLLMLNSFQHPVLRRSSGRAAGPESGSG
jgi:tRNA(Ile)-lysidine synthase